MNRVWLFGVTMLLACTSSAESYVVSQKHKAFLLDGEFVKQMTVVVGDTVDFRNDDPFFHNVFSLSSVERFDLGIFPQGESRAVIFDQQGTVEVECSIHPYMHLTVEVINNEQ